MAHSIRRSFDMAKFKVEVSPVHIKSGEPIGPELIDRHISLLVAWAERFGEFLLALVNDDDLAVIARTSALCERSLRHAIQEKLPKPDFLQWQHMGFGRRLELALALDILEPETAPLLRAVYALRNKVLHDSPIGAVAEKDVKKLLASIPKEYRKQLAEQRDNLKEPKFLALPEFQRDLRVLSLSAYSICQNAERRAQGIVVEKSDGKAQVAASGSVDTSSGRDHP
jgi:hypothetical protein